MAQIFDPLNRISSENPFEQKTGGALWTQDVRDLVLALDSVEVELYQITKHHDDHHDHDHDHDHDDDDAEDHVFSFALPSSLKSHNNALNAEFTASRLLKCFGMVVMTLRKRRIQQQIQSLTFQWLCVGTDKLKIVESAGTDTSLAVEEIETQQTTAKKRQELLVQTADRVAYWLSFKALPSGDKYQAFKKTKAKRQGSSEKVRKSRFQNSESSDHTQKVRTTSDDWRSMRKRDTSLEQLQETSDQWRNTIQSNFSDLKSAGLFNATQDTGFSNSRTGSKSSKSSTQYSSFFNPPRSINPGRSVYNPELKVRLDRWDVRSRLPEELKRRKPPMRSQSMNRFAASSTSETQSDGLTFHTLQACRTLSDWGTKGREKKDGTLPPIGVGKVTELPKLGQSASAPQLQMLPPRRISRSSVELPQLTIDYIAMNGDVVFGNNSQQSRGDKQQDDSPKSTARTAASSRASSRERGPCYSRREEDGHVGAPAALKRNTNLAANEAILPSPEGMYFQGCAKLQSLPKMPRFLVRPKEADDINLSGLSLNDEDFRPILYSMLAVEKPLTTIDLSGNCLSDRVLLNMFEEVVCHAKHFRMLHSLDLSSCKLSYQGFVCLSGLLQQELRNLKSFRLCGVPVPERAWEPLALAIKNSEVETLGLADTRLGRHTQVSCEALCQVFLDSSITTADLSSNFFGADGFKVLGSVLAQDTSLTDLDLSGNSAGLAANAAVGPGSARFSPMLLLLEVLDTVMSLQTLRLSNCLLGYEADFILMSVCQIGRRIKQLDLSHNPHGQDGLQCLIRLMVEDSGKQGLSFINLQGSRAAVPVTEEKAGNGVSTAQRLNFKSPSGAYRLCLRHPQHRTIIRTLLNLDQEASSDPRACRGRATLIPRAATGCDPLAKIEDLMRREEGSSVWRKEEKPKFFQKQRLENCPMQSRWEVPHDGEVEFTFKQPDTEEEMLQDPAIGDEQVLVDRWVKHNKVSCSFTRFASIFAMYCELVNEEPKKLFLQALAEECTLKVSHVQHLLKHTPEVARTHVIQTLFSAIEHHDKVGMFEVAQIVRSRSNVLSIMKSAANFVFFNPRHVDGSYQLDITNNCNYAVLELIFIINRWQRLSAMRKDILDRSQHGDGNNLRNVRLNGAPVKFHTAWNPERSGVVAFDYVTPFHVTHQGGEKQAHSVHDSVITRIIKLLNGCDNLQMAQKLKCLRLIIHRLVIKACHMKIMIDAVVPTKKQKEEQKSKRRAMVSGVVKDVRDQVASAMLAQTKQEAKERKLQKGAVAKTGTKEFGKTKSETNPGEDSTSSATGSNYLSTHMHSRASEIRDFSMNKDGVDPVTTVAGVWARLDSSLCDRLMSNTQQESQEGEEEGETMAARVELVQMLFSRCIDQDVFCSGAMLYHKDHFDLREVYAIRSRIGHLRCFDIFHCHQEALPETDCSSPMVFKSAPEQLNWHGNVFAFDLSVYEDWQCSRAVLALADNDNQGRLLDCRCTGFESQHHVGGVWAIPPPWFKDGPVREGVFTMRYTRNKREEGGSNPDLTLRWDIAVKTLGWYDSRQVQKQRMKMKLKMMARFGVH